MMRKEVQVASAILLIGLLALFWPIQTDAWPEDTSSAGENQDFSAVKLGALGGSNSIFNSSRSSARLLPIPPAHNYRQDQSRVGEYFVQGRPIDSWAYAVVAALEGQQSELGLLNHSAVIRLDPDELIRNLPSHRPTIGTWPFEYVYVKGLRPYTKMPCPQCSPNGRLMKGKAVFSNFLGTEHNKFPTIDELLSKLVEKGPLMVGLRKESLIDGEYDVPPRCAKAYDADYFVLLTGYDSEYLTFKNFMGQNWGLQGYGRIKRQNGCNPFAYVAY